MKIEYINLKEHNIEIPVKIFLPKNTVKKNNNCMPWIWRR